MAQADSTVRKLPEPAAPAYRTAPHNIEAEQALLGAILVNNEAFYRVGDFLEFAELLCHDALHREESCGAHFREEHQTALGEPVRDDAKFSYVAAWEYVPNSTPALHKEPLLFEFVKPTMRTY